jgi:3-phosphoshikimate 1-carboxyvinyltransferase
VQNDKIEIQPTGPLFGTVRPPGSKSITNRALVCAALAEGVSTLRAALDSEDTRVMSECLRRLGIAVEHDRPAATMRIEGCGGRIPAERAELDVANSGTTARFLTAVAALGHGNYRLDGTPRMRERPLGDLLDALGQLSVRVQSEGAKGCPPIRVAGAGLPGGRARVQGNVSSQFLSGLLMAAPCAAGPIEVEVDGELVSRPYVDMTLAVMRAFGATIEAGEAASYRVPAPQRYQPREYPVEPDASAASYFFGAAAITGGEITVDGLGRDSLQGDLRFADCLAEMGCTVRQEAGRTTVRGGRLRGVRVDMNEISDTVQTMAAVAALAEGPTEIINVGHIRHKETDRLRAVATELRKLGTEVDERPDGLRIVPKPLRAAEIDTYDDHRMAMSFALVGLAIPGVIIRDPGCTAKTYPGFFDDLALLAAGNDR